MAKVKIICTIGPASESPEVLDRLIEAGMDAARLNFSHGTHETHRRAIRAVHEAAARRGASVAVIQDLQGPRIRVGRLPDGGIELRTGETVRLRAVSGGSGQDTSADEIPVSYPALAKDVNPGAKILLDDGAIELAAERAAAPWVYCRVVAGGRLTSHKGMNLPGTTVSAPTLTEKDREDLRFGMAQDVDYVALSFVRGADDVAAAKKLMAEYGGSAPIIAKIERPEAIASLEAILREADGVMIARGDLGVEMEPEEVPLLQKRIIREANRRQRLVITATQMLESMTGKPRPTRAEASDVANAVFDGTDVVMLSAETAGGRYPVEAVRVMERIVRAAEEGMSARLKNRPLAASAEADSASCPEAMCEAARSAAAAVGASAIVVFTESGTTARLLARLRPAAPIVAFTPSEAVRRRMALYWGVLPRTMGRIEAAEERVRAAERRLKAERLVAAGDRVVILSGTIAGQPGGTNTMKLHEVG